MIRWSKLDPLIFNSLWFLIVLVSWLFIRLSLDSLLPLIFAGDEILDSIFLGPILSWISSLISLLFQGFLLTRFQINLGLWFLAALISSALSVVGLVNGSAGIIYIIVMVADFALLHRKVTGAFAWLVMMFVLPFMMNGFEWSTLLLFPGYNVSELEWKLNVYGFLAFVFSVGTTWAVSRMKRRKLT